MTKAFAGYSGLVGIGVSKTEPFSLLQPVTTQVQRSIICLFRLGGGSRIRPPYYGLVLGGDSSSTAFGGADVPVARSRSLTHGVDYGKQRGPETPKVTKLFIAIEFFKLLGPYFLSLLVN